MFASKCESSATLYPREGVCACVRAHVCVSLRTFVSGLTAGVLPSDTGLILLCPASACITSLTYSSRTYARTHAGRQAGYISGQSGGFSEVVLAG